MADLIRLASIGSTRQHFLMSNDKSLTFAKGSIDHPQLKAPVGNKTLKNFICLEGGGGEGGFAKMRTKAIRETGRNNLTKVSFKKIDE